MNRGMARWLLLGLFVLNAALRIWLAASLPHPGYDAYWTLRLTDHIVETGQPLVLDPLGFGGRTLRMSPLFYYVLAPFRLVMPAEVFISVVPNLLAATLVIALYRLSMRLTASPAAALFVAALGGLNPFFLQKALVGDVAALAVPLLLFALDAVLRVPAGEPVGRAVGLGLVLGLLHPIALVFVAGLLLYLLLLKLEGLGVEPREMEVTLFVGLFTLWLQLLLFKPALAAQGLQVLWLNIPRSLLDQQFAAVGLVQVLGALGALAVLLGAIGLYRSVVSGRRRAAALLFALILAVSILLGLRLVPFTTGLMWLGLLLACFAGDALANLAHYLRQTKLPRLARPVTAVLGLLCLLGASLVAVEAAGRALREAPSDEEFAALGWLAQSTPAAAKIWAPVEEGHLVAYAAERKTAYDLWFFGVPEGPRLYEELEALALTPFEVEAVEGLNRHGITHVYLSPRALAAPGGRPAFIESSCFALRYNASVEIYEVRCAPT